MASPTKLKKPKRFKLDGTFGRGLSGKLFSMDRTHSTTLPSNPSSRNTRGDIFDDEAEDSFSSDRREDSGVDSGIQDDNNVMLHGKSGTEKFRGKGSYGKQCENRNRKASSSNQAVFLLEDDELSAGLPSDIPSGLVDIEGDIIGDMDIRFGQEEDDLPSLDDQHHYHRHNYPSGHSTDVRSLCGPHSSRQHLSRSYSTDQKSRSSVNNNSIRIHTPALSIPNGSLGSPIGSHERIFLQHGGDFCDFLRKGSGAADVPFLHSYARSPHAPVDRHNSSSVTSNNSSTITQHYYPEGGWGYVVLIMAFLCHALLCGMQWCAGIIMCGALKHFGNHLRLESGWLGSVSLGVSLLFSPVWVSICKRKSTRLSAVFGGLVASLGCLFTSFASQFHQLFFSYGAFMGIGVGLTRDASSLMVGQYFKRKRELVEIVVVAGSGLGILLMSISIQTAISSLGWRLGLQAVTGALFFTFFLGTCYRSASLYHPQRRAILHLKNQKRKVKEKEKREEKPPFLDCSCLRSKTLQILLLSSAFTSLGINTPLFYLALECADEGLPERSLIQLHVYVGASWIIGCCLFGLVVVQKNQDCRVSKQYLCQVASVICGISVVALTAVKGYSGLVIFAWVYGFSLGGYNYALKVYTYERVRARHFPRAWSFLQSAQAVPIFIGVPLTGYVNASVGWKAGYYISAMAIFIGSACLFLTDVRRRRLSRRKSQNSSMKTCETTDGSQQSPKTKRLSFAFPVEQVSPQSKHESDEEDEVGVGVDPSVMLKELTCISEEGIADMDFQDIYFDDWAEYFGECITSCNKVENCLASEYDPDYAVLVERRARRWSAARQGLAASAVASGSSALTGPNSSGVMGIAVPLNAKQLSSLEARSHGGPSRDVLPLFRSYQKGHHLKTQQPPRNITVIDEDSV